MISQELTAFLNEWNNEERTVLVHTSGSTGTPKPMWVEKNRMLASARITCQFLGLKPGDKALLCLPLQYIAGKMMVVRALVQDMQLIPVAPSAHPLAGLDTTPDFAAMVPLQIYETMQHEQERALLRQIRQVLIGGGAVSDDLITAMRDFPNAIWSTYGMTETLSHIALRRLNGPHASEWYKPLDGVLLSQTDEGCLVIEAPAICAEKVVTHDIVEMNTDGGFRIIGRSDNVICSGGIKIQIEEVEQALQPIFGDTIQVTAKKHPKFGELVVYLTTQPIDEHLLRLCLSNPYWLPRKIILVDRLPRTATGKPDRQQARIIADPSIQKTPPFEERKQENRTITRDV